MHIYEDYLDLYIFNVFFFSSLFLPAVSQGPDKCCFSFSNVRIPVKQVVSIHTTHLECHRSGNM